MSNNTFGHGYQQPNNMSNPVPPRHDKIDRFFAWIRGSGLMRGNNRWIAGVCDGIAVRYGLSPVFVRAVVAASTLICGFGAAFYAAAWVLLPDCRDGRISGEELVYGQWQWSLLGPIIFMIIAFCFPGIGVLLSIIAVAVLLIMINSLANKAQQQRGAAYANNGRQGQYQSQPQGEYQARSQQPQGQYGQSQQPQGPYQTGPMPYAPSGSANPTFYGNTNSAPYAAQPWQQTQGNSQAGTQRTQGMQGNNEATFREQNGVNADDRVENADANANVRQTDSNPEPDELKDDHINNVDSSDTGFDQNRFGNSGQTYAADARNSQNGTWNERQNASRFNGQPSRQSWASPFAAGTTQASAAPPTYMAEPTQPYQQSQVQSAARPWGPRRARRKPAGFVIVLLALGAILLSGALVAMHCLSNGGYISTFFRYGTYWIGGVLLGLGVLIAVLGLAGHRAGGLHPLVWVAAFMAVVFVIGDIGYSTILTSMEQANTTYHHVDLSGYKAIDGSDDQQFKKLEQGIAVKGERLDDQALNIDMSDYAKTHGTHKVTLVDGTTVESGCPTGTIKLTAQQATVFVTLPAGCSYGLTADYSDLGPDGLSDAERDLTSAGYPLSTGIGTRSLGNGYVALMRGEAIEVFGSSRELIASDSKYRNEKEYQWAINMQKLPKNSVELRIEVSYVVEGRVTVQYPEESMVPSYAQFVKGKTAGTWGR
ncbi:PspC domain-containing protein [Bifidobacterium sp. ESL0690]|uniref:PspC domain-containing protein n=1 Tax=Bifidobacterium sp. ESL0690 TaxID=2983214 RepID=UPI0023F6A99E|nr:PspC domain-containing protein [Bifidobacterium sp. ESL0690]WEV47224.1 PspC domain-containing protein [Bifidobacterium sp. ESL0690]